MFFSLYWLIWIGDLCKYIYKLRLRCEDGDAQSIYFWTYIWFGFFVFMLPIIWRVASWSCMVSTDCQVWLISLQKVCVLFRCDVLLFSHCFCWNGHSQHSCYQGFLKQEPPPTNIRLCYWQLHGDVSIKLTRKCSIFPHSYRYSDSYSVNNHC